ncbi:TadE/TadG family type IV pilus assembly protein [Rhodobium gokarnense]|uniref:Flp pilus assembly protein TadG n=1 Tax=Rhodobium gokarnense TaxID=364296 RepID=A0ABT3H7Z0_9HYPH|nr:TadE/TadG family type IV pilus assembly protein [Rhodobium gokarnense]MCW2306510.1 Flp pilus assembly protein TadG [Rhodobium gokarnense]
MTYPSRIVQTVVESARRFHRDLAGIAAVEFALLAPILITTFIGTVELSEAITINRKITQTASTLADLVTQETQMTDDEIDNVFSATEMVMSPYDASGLKIIVSAVGEDEDTGNAEVKWSKAQNDTAWSKGAAPPIAIPDSLDLSDQWLIIAKVEFSYEAIFPTLADELFGSPNFEMEETTLLRPRNSATIEYN